MDAHTEKLPNDGCWLWTGTMRPNGYGIAGARVNGRRLLAHRAAWELFHESTVPDGLFVCHSCDNPRCVNPAHLFIGTALDNNRDAAMKGRSVFGERAGSAKLSREQVLEILTSNEPRQELAARFQIRPGTITAIRTPKSKRWAWLREQHPVTHQGFRSSLRRSIAQKHRFAKAKGLSA